MAQAIDLDKAFNIPDIITSICNWNAARYEQEFVHCLTIQLLNEELEETLNAKTLVDTLDGLGDIFYVAVGAAWKQGMSPSIILAALDEVDSTPTPPIELVIKWFDVDPGPYILISIANAAFRALALYLDGNCNDALAVIRAICISNDTKVVVRTSSDVKANLVKGDKYVPPTKALKLIAKLHTKEAPNVH